jgi:hypothetical protein
MRHEFEADAAKAWGAKAKAFVIARKGTRASRTLARTRDAIGHNVGSGYSFAEVRSRSASPVPASE